MIFRLLIILLFCCVAVAGEQRPADPRSLYNQGAELAASEHFDEAVETLRQVAVVRDRTIAAKALSMLGQIATASAKQSIAENPLETSPEQRNTIFEHLQSAEQSFVSSLSLQPSEEIRVSLETLRAWRHNMTNAWEKYDREQQRNAEVQQRIKRLADWEEKLMETTRPLLEEPNSPRKFQTEYESGREQKQLAEELKQLQEISIDDEDLKEKWEQFPEIQKIADETAALLAKHRSEEALSRQQQILDYLRSLLKQEQSQDQQGQDQEQSDKEKQDQEQSQEQQSNNASNDNGKQEQDPEMSQPQETRQEGSAQKEELPEEKAERLLLQVRRKEQAAKELREQIKTLLMQMESVEKDW